MFTIRIVVFTLLATACATGNPRVCTDSECKSAERLDIAHQYRSSVKLLVTLKDGSAAIGSGVAVGPGTIVTAAHVVDGDSPVIEVSDYRGQKFVGKILRVDTALDIAVVSVFGSEALTDYQAPVNVEAQPGDYVCSVGGTGYTYLVRKCGYVAIQESPYGVVAGVNVVPGNSGSGLWLDGSLIGIVVRGTWMPGHEPTVAFVPYERWAMMLPKA